jgi:hypothetical protein
MHIGIKDLHFQTYALSAGQHGSTQKPHVRSVLISVQFVGTELGMLLAVKAQGRCKD